MGIELADKAYMDNLINEAMNNNDVAILAFDSLFASLESRLTFKQVEKIMEYGDRVELNSINRRCHFAEKPDIEKLKKSAENEFLYICDVYVYAEDGFIKVYLFEAGIRFFSSPNYLEPGLKVLSIKRLKNSKRHEKAREWYLRLSMGE